MTKSGMGLQMYIAGQTGKRSDTFRKHRAEVHGRGRSRELSRYTGCQCWSVSPSGNAGQYVIVMGFIALTRSDGAPQLPGMPPASPHSPCSNYHRSIATCRLDRERGRFHICTRNYGCLVEAGKRTGALLARLSMYGPRCAGAAIERSRRQIHRSGLLSSCTRI